MQTQAVCPKCGSENLNYGDSEPIDEEYVYEFTCDNCGFEGKEWYKMTFLCYTDNDGNEIK